MSDKKKIKVQAWNEKSGYVCVLEIPRHLNGHVKSMLSDFKFFKESLAQANPFSNMKARAPPLPTLEELDLAAMKLNPFIKKEKLNIKKKS